MKNYQVLSKVGRFSACVEREFDEYTDAKAFCDLLKKSSELARFIDRNFYND